MQYNDKLISMHENQARTFKHIAAQRGSRADKSHGECQCHSRRDEHIRLCENGLAFVRTNDNLSSREWAQSGWPIRLVLHAFEWSSGRLKASEVCHSAKIEAPTITMPQSWSADAVIFASLKFDHSAYTYPRASFTVVSLPSQS